MKPGTIRPFVFFLLLLSGFTPVILKAQYFAPKNYPQQYFQWPVGAKVGIAANFGELRPNHYHMGLDCKTDQRVNLPVYAAAEGYIARVKIDANGFGRSITINHPNGLSTLYAHLNDFYPALQQYIIQQQYRLQQWDITINIPENIFPVKKGDFIAYSGNTGGSQGPHLHFEVRDTKSDKVLNPLLFGFPIPDAIAPDILRLAVYDRSKSVYEQTPKIYPLKKTNGVYRTAAPVVVNTDLVSFAITAYDRYSGSTNQNGIYSAVLYKDDVAVSGFEMDSIGYDETRYLNAHVDYKTRSIGGPWLEFVSRLPGYINGIYKGETGAWLNTDSLHQMRIVVSDANGNSSTLEFSVKVNAVEGNNNAVDNDPVFKPGFINVFENNRVSFYLPERLVYDSFHFRYREINPGNNSTIFQLHNTTVPLHGYFPLKIKADFPVNDTGRIIMKRFAGSKEDYKKTVCENGWYKASFREFGNFQLLVDSIPPTVNPIGFKDGMNMSKAGRIRFAVSDNCEDIKKFTGLLDGNWILFSNDKSRVFIYDFDEHCEPGVHELVIIAEDLAGNKTEKKYRFTR